MSPGLWPRTGTPVARASPARPRHVTAGFPLATGTRDSCMSSRLWTTEGDGRCVHACWFWCNLSFCICIGRDERVGACLLLFGSTDEFSNTYMWGADVKEHNVACS